MIVIAENRSKGAIVVIVTVSGKSSLLFYLARHNVAVSDTQNGR